MTQAATMEAEFLELMPDTVTIEPYLTQDVETNAQFGPAYRCRARIESTKREFYAHNGLVRVASTVVYPFNPPQVPTPRDRFTLPDGSQPACFGVDRVTDDDGVHHFEIYLGMTPRQ